MHIKMFLFQTNNQITLIDTAYWLNGMPFESYLSSWDAFRWPTLEQHLLF